MTAGINGKKTAETGLDRDERGRFAQGNKGGPGRPPRATEATYLRTLSDSVPTDVWGRICERAARDAQDGDARAREWLTRHLLGSHPPTLLRLALVEAAGITATEELRHAAETDLSTPTGSVRSLLHATWSRRRAGDDRLAPSPCGCPCGCNQPAERDRGDGVWTCEACAVYASGPDGQEACRRMTEWFDECHRCRADIEWTNPPDDPSHGVGACACGDDYWGGAARGAGDEYWFGGPASRRTVAEGDPST